MAIRAYLIWVGWERLYGLKYNIPPMGVLRMAGETPDGVDLRLTDEMVSPVDLEADADIVGLSVLTPAATHAYELADHFRARGCHVAMGGAHPSVLPEEAAQHVDTVFVGEAEGQWSQFLQDFAARRPAALYRADALPDLRNLSPLRRDLLAREVYPYRYPVKYGIESVELSRGCAARCSYCSVGSIHGSMFRNRPLADIEQEFEDIGQTDGIIFFTDNNLLLNWDFTRQALERLTPHQKDWFGLLSPDRAGASPEKLDLMVDSGMCGIYGSITAVTGRESAGTLRRRMAHLRRVLDRGVAVIGTIALGLDNHDSDVFARSVEFCRDAGLKIPEFVINTPFPGSRLHRECEAEGRLFDRTWSHYNGSHCVFCPRHMSPGRLEEGYRWCYEAFYGDGDRDEALYDAFRGRVLAAMMRVRARRLGADARRVRMGGAPVNGRARG